MSNVTTLNQINQNLAEIASKHLQIEAYQFGFDATDFYTSGVVECTQMWASPISIEIGVSTLKPTIRVWILDAVKRGQINETEVQSDMGLIAMDIIAQLRNPLYGWDYERNQTNVLTYFSEKSPYKWTGVYFDFTVKLLYPSDRCQIPFSSTPTIYPTL